MNVFKNYTFYCVIDFNVGIRCKNNYDKHQIELSDKVIGELIAYDITNIGGVRLDQEPKLINFFQLVDSIDFIERRPYMPTRMPFLRML